MGPIPLVADSKHVTPLPLRQQDLSPRHRLPAQALGCQTGEDRMGRARAGSQRPVRVPSLYKVGDQVKPQAALPCQKGCLYFLRRSPTCGGQSFCVLPSYLGILGTNRSQSGRSHTGHPQPQGGTGTCHGRHIFLGERLPSYSHTLQRNRLSGRLLCRCGSRVPPDSRLCDEDCKRPKAGSALLTLNTTLAREIKGRFGKGRGTVHKRLGWTWACTIITTFQHSYL